MSYYSIRFAVQTNVDVISGSLDPEDYEKLENKLSENPKDIGGLELLEDKQGGKKDKIDVEILEYPIFIIDSFRFKINIPKTLTHIGCDTLFLGRVMRPT